MPRSQLLLQINQGIRDELQQADAFVLLIRTFLIHSVGGRADERG